MSTNGQTCIRVRGLHYAHPGGVVALQGVDLELTRGQHAALLGANGSGKTTLARCLNGLLIPTQGSVHVAGVPVQPDRLIDVRRHVAMVFQNPDDQLVAPTVETDLAFGLENHGVPHIDMHARIDELLTIFDLADRRHHPPHLLSGGERQRLAVAAAVAVAPDFLVLDEPTALLDPQARRDLLQLIDRLCHENGMGVLHITQIPEEAARADRVLVLDRGRLVQDDEPRAVFARIQSLTELGLAAPFAVDVAAAAGAAPGAVLHDDELVDWLTTHRQAPAEPSSPPSVGGSSEAAMSLHDVTHSYGDGTTDEIRALDGVSVDFCDASVTALIGSSGSGKTTLVQHLNGLLRPTSGLVLLRGSDIWATGESQAARRQVGLVFQFPEAQLFEETVLQDVAFGPTCHGATRAEAHQRAVDALNLVGLPADEFGARPPLSLSGGERRRAAIAGVLAIAPGVVVLDEPTAGLDPANEQQVARLLRDLVEAGHCVILVSHDMDRVAELADTVVALEAGRISGRGSTRAFFEASQDSAAPAATRLTARLRSHGWHMPSLLTKQEACLFVASLQPTD